MIQLVDINVVFSLLVKNHVHHHTVSWQWWEGREYGSVGMCLLCRMGILRLLTNNKVMNGQEFYLKLLLEPGNRFQRIQKLRGLPHPRNRMRCIFDALLREEGRHQTFGRMLGLLHLPSRWLLV